MLINPWTIDVYPPPSIGYLQGAIKDYFKDEVKVTACNLENLDSILSKETFDLTAVSFHSFSVRHAIGIRNKIKVGKKGPAVPAYKKGGKMGGKKPCLNCGGKMKKK